MGRNAQRRRREVLHDAVRGGSASAAISFARENRWLMVEAAMQRDPNLSPVQASQLVDRLLNPPQHLGLGEKLKAALLGLVTLVAAKRRPA